LSHSSWTANILRDSLDGLVWPQPPVRYRVAYRKAWARAILLEDNVSPLLAARIATAEQLRPVAAQGALLRNVPSRQAAFSSVRTCSITWP
jgi:hypothetical protein